MSLNLHFLDSCLNFLTEDSGDVRDEQGEGFHQKNFDSGRG